ncbi:Pectinesterase inhibitor 4 [Arabidopsis thaliana]|uniref:Pectinesterase inhibitor 4 n=4 Tax=Arabidopsis TaxID=3701 RepID=PMEI4_ARATH|nr:Plant invertase/pectin methylesterase inhibitor superfamily protein [Arabidopsis thaliana]Q9SB38.1 RecName: Full=Pectinesterase inhibitor 4; AltName: Full=Pectin methylesterase inhibitor 4; Short=AtPMEI4; Flags: Precursor [Arabidopsis thaliana]KAG7617265.1 Pectinesterase inhibitor domain [Arabidopsis thaliana x Arabidopsis arenosa]KAG7621733.1 Pectinesterase inhibitor domain [Arabidopsis suecica]AAO42834.1 At4g25250 [Arabidopsis thaliana]AEE85031.1 Plant invertase/pectin methylesterase inhi|eukprot:NP_194255.1 Plant invertase/pectin methylesterase inhibitor superfamily protein [Arabidopsis thaliana]
MLRFVVLSLTLMVFINSSNFPKTAATPPGTYQNHTTYVKTACNSTTYPTMCYNCLSSYSSTIKSDPIKLCTTSLNLNVKSAKNATLVVSNLLQKAKAAKSHEVSILKDCVDEMKDTIDELKQAVAEMKYVRGGGKTTEEHLKNVKTWVSSALTDEGTCTDGFEEGRVNVETKKKVKKAISELSKTTSNTLALLTHYLSY